MTHGAVFFVNYAPLRLYFTLLGEGARGQVQKEDKEEQNSQKEKIMGEQLTVPAHELDAIGNQ
jgi:hypothetical protein